MVHRQQLKEVTLMPGHGRTIGFILIAIAVVVLLASVVWLLAEPATGTGGKALGLLMVLLVFVLPLGGGGAYLVAKGRKESAEYTQIAKEKKILNMVLAQGKVTLAEVALEIDAPIDQVEDMVRDLVGKNLFSGAINWEDGVLYSRQASQMKADRKCPNCGGELTLAGKGVIKCPSCGSEVFLAS
jgi:DNA-directed RNA polymerase subunit RPC12/RpoP